MNQDMMVIPKSVVEYIKSGLEDIRDCEKHPEKGYAYALGVCNGKARMLLISLDVYAKPLEDK